MTSIVNITSAAQLAPFYVDKKLVVISFWAEWCDSCKPMRSVLEQLARQFPDVHILEVEAEEVDDVAEQFEVTAVPSFVFIKGENNVIDRLTGSNPGALATKVRQWAAKNSAAVVSTPDHNPEEAEREALNEKLRKLINYAPVMLFMKGVPSEPKCKFSRQAIEILKSHNIPFSSFNILSDDTVRQGLKTYSNWPTFPQFYVDGSLLGGLDIVKELVEEGELKAAVRPALEKGVKARAEQEQQLNDRLNTLINSAPVMLFMKGTPDSPQCGFSNQMVGILNSHGIKYGSFNILADNDVRQGLKAYSNWPTFPQLYANGKLVGGLDIVKELVEDGELEDAVQAQ